jgi:hypothetical protein
MNVLARRVYQKLESAIVAMPIAQGNYICE